jgi:hypothetical protein
MTLEMAHCIETRYTANSGSIGNLLTCVRGVSLILIVAGIPTIMNHVFRGLPQPSKAVAGVDPTNEATTAFFRIDSNKLCGDHHTI